MKRRCLAVLVLASLVLLACQENETSPPSGADRSPPPTPATSPGPDDHAQIYAAVIRRLVTRDHTFGRSTSPFDYIYVVDGVVPTAGRPRGNTRRPSKPFSEETRQAITARLEQLPPVEFIDDPDSVRVGRQGLGGVKNDGVIITLGPITKHGSRIHVPNGLWCGGLCGQWLTYVLKHGPRGWEISGTTGSAAIS